MEIYNTDVFEKLKIKPINVNDLHDSFKRSGDFKTINNVVTDVDNNSYDGIMINGRVWMKSNLRTTKLNDGSEIGDFQYSNNGEKPYVANLTYHGYVKEFGYYYNFHAVNTGKLAPEGWHVPSLDEWKDMLTYVTYQTEYNNTPNKHEPFTSHIAKSLCYDSLWKYSKYKEDIGNIDEECERCGFNVYPAGYWDYYTHNYICFKEKALLWSTTSINNKFALFIGFDYNSPIVHGGDKCRAKCNEGFCVRCVKD